MKSAQTRQDTRLSPKPKTPLSTMTKIKHVPNDSMMLRVFPASSPSPHTLPRQQGRKQTTHPGVFLSNVVEYTPQEGAAFYGSNKRLPRKEFVPPGSSPTNVGTPTQLSARRYRLSMASSRRSRTAVWVNVVGLITSTVGLTSMARALARALLPPPI